MAGQVIHVDAALHQHAKEYCLTKGIKLKDWVESLMRTALSGQPIEPVAASPRIVPPVQFDPVLKKTLPVIESLTVEESPPWARPPFWKTSEMK